MSASASLMGRLPAAVETLEQQAARAYKQVCRLDDDLDTELLPGQIGGVALGADLDGLAVDDDAAVVVGHLTGEAAEDRVVLEQVGQGLVVRQVVDGDNLDIGALLEGQRGRSCGRSGRSR